MREIKFRLWDKIENQMIYKEDYGSKDYPILLAIGLHGLPIAIDETSFKQNEIIGWNRDHNLIPMEYTGLKDKNGKEIYESDVVEITKQCIFERGLVIFKNGCFFIKVKETLLPLYECEINKFELKVIGNKFDNPELLEKGKE